MAANVKKLNGNEPPLELKLDTTRYLNEYNEKDSNNSCSGGVVLHARRGKIVVSNTLDDRIELCYQEAIPEIRTTLFPVSLYKEPKPVKNVN
jgi:vacuolar-type H+-ATPase subunit E/Vma4